ncbi:ATP-binding protein [Modestobacter sp. VKM Ac-2977]|uniref:AlbA family DNA-binding domain-containing protein n=1 Tax=Modestobacter sp. VKM Ac-2977 TaxID=3004131 RepID=UPI0022AA1C5A|nr:ATP-binding protein [Modestobacter sp. VKM Ac-2977]MCZ2821938.1 ATP-binding protein [Modestobacter sp. VKM Ac-2977]
MSAWRSPELEARLGGPLDQQGVTLAALERLVAGAEPEGEQLDYKQPGAYARTTGARPEWTREQEFAKDVCALANQRGGLIVIGIRDADEQAAELTPVDGSVEAFHALDQRLRLALANNAAPLPAIDTFPVPVSDFHYCAVVVVPPSPRAPHAVVAEPGRRLALRYPARDGAATRWLNEAEVAARYEGRVTNEAATDLRIAKAVGAGTEALRRGQGLWTYVAVSPEFAAPVRVDAAFIDESHRWLGSNSGQSPFASFYTGSCRPIAGPGCVTFTSPAWREGDEDTDPREVYLALYADGSAFVALALEPVQARTSGVGENTLVDSLIALTATAVSWTVSRSGAWGGAVLQAGLAQSEADNGVLTPPLPLLSAAFGIVKRQRRTRMLTRDPAVRIPVDLGAVRGVQDHLAITWQAASAMFQHFGLPEATQLTADGALRPWQWTDKHRRQVEEWAAERAIPAVR